MIFPGLLNKRAALVLVGGVAFLFFGCRGGVKNQLSQNSGLDLKRADQKPHPVESLLLNAQGAQYTEAIKLLKEAHKAHQDPSLLPQIKYQLSRLLARIGAHRASIKVLEDWEKRFPHHPLKGKVLTLMASNHMALNDLTRAFYWLLKLRDYQNLRGPNMVEEIEEEIETTIERMGARELEQAAAFASAADYAPLLHYRLYHLYREAGDLIRAREAATAIMRSTDDKYWVSVGRGLLDELSWLLFADSRKIGCLLPLSGPFAIYGQEVLRGIEMGLGLYQDVGKAISFELVLEDTEAREETVEEALERLAKEERVIAVIGPLRGVVAEAAARKAETLGVPLIVISQRPGITRLGNMVFQNFLTPKAEVAGLVKMAVEELGIRKGAILYPDTGYGRTLADIFEKEFMEMGGRVVVKESYDPEQTDFAKQIKKMAWIGVGPQRKEFLEQLSLMRSPEEEEAKVVPFKSDPIVEFDAIFIPDHYERVAMLVPQLVYHEIRGPLILGTSTWQSEKLLDLAGEYLEGGLFPSGFFPAMKSPLTKGFVESYREVFGVLPGVLAACGYDTIGILKEILSKQRVETRADLQKALLEHPGFHGVSGIVKFDKGGELERDPLILTISRGRFLVF